MFQPFRQAKVSELVTVIFLSFTFNNSYRNSYFTTRACTPFGFLGIGYYVCIRVAFLLLFFSALPLIYYWHTGRFADKRFLSSATERYSIGVRAASAVAILATLFTLTTEIINLLAEVRWNALFYAIFINAIVAWLGLLIVLFALVLFVVQQMKRQIGGERLSQPGPAQEDERESLPLLHEGA